MRVIATAYLVEGDRNYSPGDVIADGLLYQQAEYYARLGHVRIVESDSEDEPSSTPDEPLSDGADMLDEMTVAQLQAMARARGIPYSGLRKAELIETLRGG